MNSQERMQKLIDEQNRLDDSEAQQKESKKEGNDILQELAQSSQLTQVAFRQLYDKLVTLMEQYQKQRSNDLSVTWDNDTGVARIRTKRNGPLCLTVSGAQLSIYGEETFFVPSRHYDCVQDGDKKYSWSRKLLRSNLGSVDTDELAWLIVESVVSGNDAALELIKS